MGYVSSQEAIKISGEISFISPNQTIKKCWFVSAKSWTLKASINPPFQKAETSGKSGRNRSVATAQPKFEKP